VIADWSRSGLTQRAYCEREDLAVGTFAWWKHHLKTERRATAERRSRSDTPPFVQVEVRGTAQRSELAEELPVPAGIEIVSGDLVVRIFAGCDPTTLSHVVAALRGARC
jgi:hypothetical protein